MTSPAESVIMSDDVLLARPCHDIGLCDSNENGARAPPMHKKGVPKHIVSKYVQKHKYGVTNQNN